jgi:RecA-family ATPase
MVRAADGTEWPAPTEAELRAIAALRRQVWDHGFRPLPVLSHTDADPKTASKAPLGKDWPSRARKTPPEVVQFDRAAPHCANTGVLCDALRGLDIDVDDPERAKQVFELAREMLGDTITRRRDATGRRCMLYRAAEGEPGKLTLQGTTGGNPDRPDKIEILGKGQQVVIAGIHYPSHSPLYWFPVGPEAIARDDLPAVSEPQVHAFLRAAAPVIGATPPEDPATKGSNGQAGATISTADLPVDLKILASALEAIPSEVADDYHGWVRVGQALWRATGGSDVGLALWDGWSARSAKYEAEGMAKKWATFAKTADKKVDAGTIYFLAQQAGWKFPAPRPDDPGLLAAEEQAAREDAARYAEPDPRPGLGGVAPEAPGLAQDDGHALPAVPWVEQRVADLANLVLPEQRWIVPEWVPAERVTGLYGPPGCNKTDWLVQLALARGQGLPFLGRQLHPGPVYALFCEDTREEILRRIARIAAHYGRAVADFPAVHFASLVGVVATEFVTFDAAGRVQTEPPLLRFDKAICDYGATLALLDTAPDFFGGNEIVRREVGAFVRMLECIAIGRACAVVFTVHPSVRGLESGRFESGSTGWTGKLRSRLSLHDPAADDENSEDRAERQRARLPPPTSDKRRLIRQKSNYAPQGAVLELVCRNGVFVPAALDAAEASKRGPLRDRLVEDTVRDLLDKVEARGQYVNLGATHPGTYAPTAFARLDQRFSKSEFARAINRLLDAGRLRLEPFGKPSDQRRKLVPVTEQSDG